jgi:hypothetical protein
LNFSKSSVQLERLDTPSLTPTRPPPPPPVNEDKVQEALYKV